MNRYLLLAACAVLFSINVFAHEPFTLVSSEKKTVTTADLQRLESERTAGKAAGTTLTLTAKEIRLVVTTGPEDDMLSYRIQGMRNPTVVVPAGATLRLLFINSDVDMRHDVRFGHVVGEFGPAPDIKGTAGSQKLAARNEGNILQAEELVIKANDKGLYKYFCSVRTHAQGGMWGNIAVGVTPGPDLKIPVKTEHIHSADEDEGHEHHAAPAAQPTTTPAPHHHMPAATPAPHQHGATSTPTPHQHAPAAPPAPHVHGSEDKPDGTTDHAGHDMSMSSTVNIGDPMPRESSGTAWAPDSTPLYAKMKMYENGSMLMFMGTAYLRYTSIGSSRDVSIAGKGSRSRADAPSMFMAMYSRPLTAKSQIGLRAMVSLDPIIQRGWGYPLLYQSGELYRGLPIHDRQHPHDLFSELAVAYSYKFDDKRSFYLYAGYPGEPALGPPTFMHRASASNNPDAPLGHHWQDATHITWGVVTGGFSFGKVKVEASAFKGEEPDENRWNFDRTRLDSFSARVSFNPTKNWALQISHGYLRNPEPSEPEVRILRKTTASAIYNKQLGENRNLASSFVWGQNYANGERSNSYLFESNYDFYKNAVFGRFETVEKSGHDLVLDHDLEHDIFRVSALSLGYVRDVVKDKGIDVGVGGMVTANFNPSTLTPYYGGTKHAGWQIFVRFRPSKLK